MKTPRLPIKSVDDVPLLIQAVALLMLIGETVGLQAIDTEINGTSVRLDCKRIGDCLMDRYEAERGGL